MPRPSQPPSLALGPGKASADPFLDHGLLKLRENAHHLKHGLSGRRRGVEALLVQIEVDLQRMDLG